MSRFSTMRDRVYSLAKPKILDMSSPKSPTIFRLHLTRFSQKKFHAVHQHMTDDTGCPFILAKISGLRILISQAVSNTAALNVVMLS